MWFIKNEAYNKQLSDTFYLMVLQGIQYVIPLIVIPYLMVVLGAEHYGYIGFATVLCMYFNTIIDFGFNLSTTKSIAIAYEKGDNQEVSRAFFSTLTLKIIFFLISTPVCFGICFAVPQFRIYLPIVLSMYPLVIGNTFTFTFLFQGIGKIRVLSIINMLSKVLVLPLTFFFVKAPEDCQLAAFIQSGVYVLTAVISIIVLLHYSVLHRVKITKGDLKHTLKDSFPLFLSTAATTIYTNLFTVILAFFATPAMVGRYSAAERIVRICIITITQPINQAFFPKVASLGYNNRVEARALVAKMEKVVGVLMIIISIALFSFSDVISDLLGESYKNIGVLLRIMSVAPFAISIGGIMGQMGLIAIGNDISKKRFCKSYWITAPISLLSVLALSSVWNEIGAAFALLITEYTVFFLMWYYYRLDNIALKQPATTA